MKKDDTLRRSPWNGVSRRVERAVGSHGPVWDPPLYSIWLPLGIDIWRAMRDTVMGKIHNE